METSHSDPCNNITSCIWQWFQARYSWQIAAYIPGKENTAADDESLKVNLDAKWKLNTAALEAALIQPQVSPCIDPIASRLNKQCPFYVSWRADPEAHVVDAFFPFTAISHLLRVPRCQPYSSSPAEGEKGREHGRDRRACLATSSVVTGVTEDAD